MSLVKPLLENSIWKDDAEKDKFLSKHKRLTNEFWLNLFGVLALFQKYRDNSRLMMYIKQSPVRLDRVVDSNSDLMVILKQVASENLINDLVMTKITKLLAKIKMGQINSIDENLLRDDIIKKIKVSQVYPYPEMAKLIKDFVKGNKTLVDMLPEIYNIALMKKRALEFRELYKRLSHVSVDTSTQDGADAPQEPAQAQKTLSPVASALTGAPRGVATQAIKQTIVDLKKTNDKLSWNDVRALFTRDNVYSHFMNWRTLFLFYINEVCKNQQDIDNLFTSLGVNKEMFISVSSDAFRNLISYRQSAINDFKNLDPSLEGIDKLITAYGGDYTKLTKLFTEYFKNSEPIYKIYYINEVKNKINVFDKDAISASYLVMRKYSFNAFSNMAYETDFTKVWLAYVKSMFTSYANETMNVLNTELDVFGGDQLDISSIFETLMRFESKTLKILDMLNDESIAMLNFKSFTVLISYVQSNDEIEKLALRFSQLKKDCYAKGWGIKNLSDAQKVAMNIFTAGDMIEKFGQDESIKAIVNEKNIRRYIESHGVKYDEFIKAVSTKDQMRYISYFIERIHSNNLVTNAFVEIEDYDTFLLDLTKNYGDALIFIAQRYSYRGTTQFIGSIYEYGSLELVKVAVENPSFKITLISKLLNNKNVPASFIEELLLDFLLTEGRFFNAEQWKAVPYELKIPIIDKIFNTYKNAPSYEFNKFISDYQYSSYDLTKIPGFTDVLINHFKNDELSLKSIELNKETYISLRPYIDSTNVVFLDSIKNASEDDLVNMLSTASRNARTYFENIQSVFESEAMSYDELIKSFRDVKDLFTSKGQFATRAFALAMKKFIDYNTTDKLTKNFIGDVFDKDEMIGYVETIVIDRKVDRLTKYLNWNYKVSIRDVANAMDTFADSLTIVYDKYGLDPVISLIKNDKVTKLLENISSGKRLLNKSPELDSMMVTLFESSPQHLDRFFDAFPEKIAKGLFKGLLEKILILPIIEDMYKDDAAFPVKEKLSSERVRTMLKFNNFEFTGSLVRRKKNESNGDYLKRLKEDLGNSVVPQLQVEKVEETQDQLNEKTVEYSKYLNGRHGDTAVEFLETYNVNMKFSQHDNFVQRFGSDNKLVPAFHGSSLEAANFIMRFGFTILPESDKSTVGRMLDIRRVVFVKDKQLGPELDIVMDNIHTDCSPLLEDGYFPVWSVEWDKKSRSEIYEMYPTDKYWRIEAPVVGGIYIADSTEKPAQYIGRGYARQYGAVGLILELDVNLGEDGLFNHSMGRGRDSIKSPEWAVIWPKGQIIIKKAHKVKFVSKAYVNKLKSQYPHALKENKYFPNFAKYLKEEKIVKNENVVSYVFYQGVIPDTKGNMFVWQDFDTKVIKNSKKMYLDSHQQGVCVTFITNKEIETPVVHVPDTDEFILDDPEGLFSRFLNLLEECKG